MIYKKSIDNKCGIEIFIKIVEEMRGILHEKSTKISIPTLAL